MGAEIRFDDAPTLEVLLSSDAICRVVVGPRESGKTVGCAAAIYERMCLIPRCLDGIRRSRFLVYRPTYGELETGTLKTWTAWFPEEIYGPVTGSGPFVHTIRFEDVESEVHFVSLADVRALKKLRSMEFTGAWGNEVQFAPLRMVAEILDITNRYPSKQQCPDWRRDKFQILDANAPESDHHWLWYMSGRTELPRDMPDDQKMAYVKPDGWQILFQPPALVEEYDDEGSLTGYSVNPEAENLVNHGATPYAGATDGKTRDEITRDFLVRPAASRQGKARYPRFDRSWSVSKTKLTPYENAPVVLGVDPGSGASAAVFGQVLQGRWFWFEELIGDGVGMDEFAPAIVEMLSLKFPFWKQTGVSAWIDPFGGWDGGGAGTTTSKQILAGHGIIAHSPQAKDNPQVRMEIGRKVLKDSAPAGPRVPKLLICSQGCPRLIEGIENASQKQTSSNGVLVSQWKMRKDAHSHIVEAWEYALWGCGEGDALLFGRDLGNRSGDRRAHSSRRETDDVFSFRNVRRGDGRFG